MEREPTCEQPEVQKAIDKFIGLKNRFATEVTGDIATREVAEAILTEVQDTAVEALVRTGGHPNIMQALEQEFARPILSQASPDSMHHDVFRIMIANVATQVAKQFSQGK